MCTQPKIAWIPKKPDKEGKRTLVFRCPNKSKLNQYQTMKVPCNKCIACEALRSVKQAVQMACELHTTSGQSHFITLTYDDENLPDDYSVHVDHLQKFLKKLRYYLKKNNIPGKLRYTGRGEYGSETSRPHYHLAAFNLNLNDLELYKELPCDGGTYNLYESPIIEKIWGQGSCKLVTLGYENSLYIAQHHFAEKVDQEIPDHEQRIIHPVTKKLITQRNKDFSTYSSKPGIGREYFEKYFTEIFQSDSIIIKGMETSVPNYFVKLLKDKSPELFEEVKEKRLVKIKKRTLKENRYQADYDKKTLGDKGLKGKTSIKAGKYYKKDIKKKK